jgi:hypothetical protein
MRNYRRLSGDGSVKVVLSGDSNSPPKTTRRREPPSYNLSATQEVCPSIPTVPADVRRLTYPANRLRDQTYSSSQPGVSSSSGLRDLRVFVLKGEFPSHQKVQKKPVFAPIRGLCDSHSDREFSTTAFLPSATTDHGQQATDGPKNVDSPRCPRKLVVLPPAYVTFPSS